MNSTAQRSDLCRIFLVSGLNFVYIFVLNILSIGPWSWIRLSRGPWPLPRPSACVPSHALFLGRVIVKTLVGGNHLVEIMILSTRTERQDVI